MKQDDGTRKLALISRASEALTEAKTIPDVRHLIGLAKAAEAYAREVKASQAVVDQAIELRIRAERRLGEMLLAMPGHEGTRGQLRGGDGQGTQPLLASRPRKPAKTLSDAVPDHHLRARSQQLASIPEDEFEGTVAQAKAEGDLSVSRVLKPRVQQERREERTQRIVEQSRAGAGPESTTRYPVLLADPPWRYEHAVSKSREIENQYPTMALNEICELSVSALTTDDAVLYLWVTSPKLEEGLRVLNAWQFWYRSCLVWVKDRVGMGYWARQRHELLLVATKGNMPAPPPELRPDSVIEAPRGEHSAKPAAAYELIERQWPTLPKLELFARNQRDGWDRWGHEA